ncbi:NusA-like transcription termination signal-binding factor [Candidatus Micrarchaeota archaeon]|nr:NusA-like transcription termination signal-binding factor [Candidatus Micrarchaeota archaeon]
MTSVISNEELQLINLLEDSTGAKALDVVNNDDGVIFVVTQGELGKAIGKQGVNIQKLKKQFGKPVEMIEFSPELEVFLKNLFKPVAVEEIDSKEENKIVHIKVDAENKGLAIGRNGSKIKKARLLLKRLFNVDDFKIL